MSERIANYKWVPRVWKGYLDSGGLMRQRSSEQVEAIISIVQRQAPRRVLDAGCGFGRLSIELATRLPNCEFIAMDESAAMLAEVETRRLGRNMHSLQGNVECLPLKSEAVDLALCVDVLMHVGHEVAALTELARVVRRSGTLVLTFHNLLNPFALGFLSRALLRKGTGYRQSFHLPGFYTHALFKLGFDVTMHPSQVVPGFPVPQHFAEPIALLEAESRLLGHKPILECRKVHPPGTPDAGISANRG